ncbi:MAG: GC-type dockerin domain-anchored protein [Phycisphaerales bacterium]
MYWSFNDGATWVKDGADFPNVNVGDIQIDRVNNTVTVGTYGRGVYRATLFNPPPACCANCDGSTVAPVLNVNDFICFNNRFAAGDSYANCDGSTTPPVLNVNDFVCFLNLFGAGCP